MQYYEIGNKYEGFYTIGVSFDEDGYYTIELVPEGCPFSDTQMEQMLEREFEKGY